MNTFLKHFSFLCTQILKSQDQNVQVFNRSSTNPDLIYTWIDFRLQSINKYHRANFNLNLLSKEYTIIKVVYINTSHTVVARTTSVRPSPKALV